MDWHRVEGSWKQIKGSVKEQWRRYIHNDVEVIAGRRDQRAGMITDRDIAARLLRIRRSARNPATLNPGMSRTRLRTHA